MSFFDWIVTLFFAVLATTIGVAMGAGTAILVHKALKLWGFIL